MKAYYNANVHASGEDNRLTQVWGCDIFLTHGVGAPNWADTNFTCQTAPQIACWIVCFPLCLFTGVPYLCYKKCLKYVHADLIIFHTVEKFFVGRGKGYIYPRRHNGCSFF